MNRIAAFTIAALMGSQTQAITLLTGDDAYKNAHGTESARPYNDPTQTQLADNCCMFWKEKHFMGSEVGVCTENNTSVSMTLADPGMTVETQGYQSYQCGKKTFLNYFWKDRPAQIFASGGRVDNSATKDRFTDVQIGPYEFSEMPAVTYFDGESCEGNSAMFYTLSTSPGNVAKFETKDLTESGLGVPLSKNEGAFAAKSVMVPAGYVLTMFGNDSFKGDTLHVRGRFEGQKPELTQQLACQEITQGNNGGGIFSIWSLKVTLSKTDIATGYWKAITTSEQLTYTVHVGITSEDSSSSSTSNAQTLTDSLTAGASLSVTVGTDVGLYEVEGTAEVSMEHTSTEESTTQNSRDIASSSGSDQSQDYTTTCTPHEGDNRTALWQWVLATADNSISAFTSHTICRVGEKAFTPPACPWYACADVECSTCKTA